MGTAYIRNIVDRNYQNPQVSECHASIYKIKQSNQTSKERRFPTSVTLNYLRWTVGKSERIVDIHTRQITGPSSYLLCKAHAS